MYVHLYSIAWYLLFFIVILYAKSNVFCFISIFRLICCFLLCIYNIVIIVSLNNFDMVFLYAF